MKFLYAFVAIALLVSCSGGDSASAPGGVTAGEAKALDEAAEMVEAKRLPPEGMPPATGTPAAEQSGGNVNQ
jgi:hypothetical protein